jgi:glycosyltransferase involved in cell wall biosynthesis
MGSWHGPNLSAVEFVLEMARVLPGVVFPVIGSAGLAFREKVVPPNVILTGAIEDDEKTVLMRAADIALNPMITGGGSNLKMLDYAAAGLPILSTPFGARGFEFKPGMHYFAADMKMFPLELTTALVTPAVRGQLASAARELVSAKYSWKVIAEQFTRRLAARS